MSINIHGKEYITVAERVKEAHKLQATLTITTEVLYQTPVVIKATVITDRGTFTGISAANPDKMIEKASPYEVAETSAVGRALGFAGYGIVDGIATADEMAKVEKVEKDPTEDWTVPNEEKKEEIVGNLGTCAKCGANNIVYKKSGKIGCSKYCWLKKGGD